MPFAPSLPILLSLLRTQPGLTATASDLILFLLFICGALRGFLTSNWNEGVPLGMWKGWDVWLKNPRLPVPAAFHTAYSHSILFLFYSVLPFPQRLSSSLANFSASVSPWTSVVLFSSIQQIWPPHRDIHPTMDPHFVFSSASSNNVY